MEWTDLIEPALKAAGNSTRTEAVHPLQEAAIDGEKPVASTPGRHPDHFRKGVLVLTTHRLLFLKDGKPPIPVPLTAVTDATVVRSKINGDVLTVVALTGSHRFEDVVKADVFAEQVRAAARTARTAAPAPQEPAADGEQLIGQLERLAALHTSGALTDEEFTRAKQRLIG
ncbi:SHOCT domain-containing protein [Kitasatospora sp. NPDC093550]|uniref:SHOCT domain-containing protein n=1 Tax=Kitasatospora sp. NPDC093550 TaxID=3364089 RepID=UPI003812C89E